MKCCAELTSPTSSAAQNARESADHEASKPRKRCSTRILPAEFFLSPVMLLPSMLKSPPNGADAGTPFRTSMLKSQRYRERPALRLRHGMFPTSPHCGLDIVNPWSRS